MVCRVSALNLVFKTLDLLCWLFPGKILAATFQIFRCTSVHSASQVRILEGNCVCTEHVQASPLSSSVQGTLEGLLTFTLSSLFKNPDMERDLLVRSIFQRNQV